MSFASSRVIKILLSFFFAHWKQSILYKFPSKIYAMIMSANVMHTTVAKISSWIIIKKGLLKKHIKRF